MSKIKKVAIIGAGISGLGLLKLSKRLGYDVFISESKKEIDKKILDEIKNYGASYEIGENTDKIFQADALLLSSGVSPQSNIISRILRSGIEIIGELDFIYPFLNSKIIAVTGSNGKSTTVKLISHILNKNGCSCSVAGNIGISLADFVGSTFQYLAVELSSFQLYWSNEFKSDLSVITNIEPDHIDWHGTLENYINSKLKILIKKDNGLFSIMRNVDFEKYCKKIDNIIKLSWDKKNKFQTIYMSEKEAFLNFSSEFKLFNYEDVPLLGKHNMENVAMAIVAAMTMAPKINNFNIKDFVPLSHRCELVDIINGVKYVDDSKGTNVAATKTALEAIQGRKIVILGGRGKGEDYTSLAFSVISNADWAILLGEESEKIALALRRQGFEKIYNAKNMEDAVAFSYKVARKEMVVLLSPSCTSWDMYRNYKERGEHFKKIVGDLPKLYN
jgi:UDP-N-acetylmuramoylalanine--D-glutamate ligase